MNRQHNRKRAAEEVTSQKGGRYRTHPGLALGLVAMAGVWMLALPLAAWVTLAKSLYSLGLSFFYCNMRESEQVVLEGPASSTSVLPSF